MTGYAITTINGASSWRAIASESELQPGEVFATQPPAPTMVDLADALTSVVQAWMDATAQANGYDSLASCISYAGSSVEPWAADAAAALKWRDAVWLACFEQQQAALANPPDTPPNASTFIAGLPQPATFGWVLHAPGA